MTGETLPWWERLTLDVTGRFLDAFRRQQPRHFSAGLWATTRDLRTVGLLGGEPGPALVLGGWDQRLPTVPLAPLRCHGDKHPHALILSPTGGGKTWNSFLPTLLTSWHHSAAIFDVKGELHRLTSGHRAGFSRVIRFAPAELGSARYNPLDAVRPGAHAIGDVRNLVAHLAPEEHGERDRFFENAAKAYLAGVIAFVLDAAPPEERCLAGVASALARGRALGEAMKASQHPDPAARTFIREAAARLWNNASERTVGSVTATADSFLAPFVEPVMGDNTRTSDFAPADLMCADRPVSLYLCTAKPDLERTKPLLRVLIAQVMAELQAREDADRSGNPKLWRLLWALDELPALGRLANLGTDLPVMRSHGMRMLGGAQGAGQLKAVYGETAETIANNCRLLATRQNSLTEAKELSGLIGEVIESRRSVSRNFTQGGGLLSGRSESQAESWRMAMQPAEIARMPADRLLIMGEDRPVMAWRSDPSWWQPLVREPATGGCQGGEP